MGAIPTHPEWGWWPRIPRASMVCCGCGIQIAPEFGKEIWNNSSGECRILYDFSVNPATYTTAAEVNIKGPKGKA